MKKRYDLDTPDLAPDLEWMLSGGQVSSALLLERLLQEYYPRIFQLAYAILDDRVSAGQAARQVFVEAMLSTHRSAEASGVAVWLYRIAWKVCQKAQAQRKARLAFANNLPTGRRKEAPPSAPLNEVEDAGLWQAIDTLDVFPRRVLILNLLQGWPVELISQVTGAFQPEVAEALVSAQRSLSDSCPDASPPEAELSQVLQHLFSLRWPAPIPDELELDALATEIGKIISARKKRIKPVATFLEISLLAVLVLVVSGFLIWAGRGEKDSQSAAVALQATPSRLAGFKSSGTPASTYRYKPTIESPLMPRSYDFIPLPTSTATPAGVLYISQEGEELANIASRLGVSADDLRRLNRIHEDEKVAHGQLLYIPGSLPELTLRSTTAIPQPLATLPLETPASSEDITRLMFPGDPTYYTVWFDALLFMHPQLPFSDVQDVLRIQLWLSDDQALLIGGPLGEDPREVLLQDRDKIYIARPGEGNPWFQIANTLEGDMNIDPRLLYGAVSLLRRPSSFGYQKYLLSGEEIVAGRSAWKITELDEQMAPVVEMSIDKEIGFILKYSRNQEPPGDRERRAFVPLEAIIASIEYNVDFPQELFNPSLPWRGGYAWNHSAIPQRVVDAP
jgi:DNA-directed RNA polymerase specialized sigma24 family protein